MSKEMRQHIDNFRDFLTENSKKKLNISDVSESKKSKEDWWQVNYKRLLNAIEDLPYEEWEGLVKHPDDFDGVYNSTNKHRGLYLLHTYSIPELEEIIDNYTIDED